MRVRRMVWLACRAVLLVAALLVSSAHASWAACGCDGGIWCPCDPEDPICEYNVMSCECGTDYQHSGCFCGIVCIMDPACGGADPCDCADVENGGTGVCYCKDICRAYRAVNPDGYPECEGARGYFCTCLGWWCNCAWEETGGQGKWWCKLDPYATGQPCGDPGWTMTHCQCGLPACPQSQYGTAGPCEDGKVCDLPTGMPWMPTCDGVAKLNGDCVGAP